MNKLLLNVYRNCSVYNIKKAVKYVKQFGVGAMLSRVAGSNLDLSVITYDRLKQTRTDRDKKQEQEILDECKKWNDNDENISYAIVVYDFDSDYLDDLLAEKNNIISEDLKDSIKKQRYSIYKLYSLREILEKNIMLSEQYVIVTDGNGIYEPLALYRLTKEIKKTSADIVYSDEDVEYYNPDMKPDYNIDMLYSYNYIGQLCAVKSHIFMDILHNKSLICNEINNKKIGSENMQPDTLHKKYTFTGWYYNFILRATAKADNISHIAEVLYHGSRPCNGQNKAVDLECIEILNEFYTDMNIDATACKGFMTGTYGVEYAVKGSPKISVIIPNKDHVSDLKVCIESLLENNSYNNYEIIIVENNSTEAETFEYYKKLEYKVPQVKVITWKGVFDYAAINNYGVGHATGEYLLFLNNDTQMITKDGIRKLLMLCQRSNTGIAGAQMLYEDGTIQHAGVIIGLGGVADNILVGENPDSGAHHNKAQLIQDYSAVTAACMMTKKKLFEEIGGFSAKFPVAFNDVDYCMEVRKRGFLVVYNPYVKLYHYESKSRGRESSFAQVKRFKMEVNNFHSKWKQELKAGDPYYNNNLSTDRKDYTYRL